MQNEMEHGYNLEKRKRIYLRRTMSVGENTNPPVWLNFIYYAGKTMLVIYLLVLGDIVCIFPPKLKQVL